MNILLRRFSLLLDVAVMWKLAACRHDAAAADSLSADEQNGCSVAGPSADK